MRWQTKTIFDCVLNVLLMESNNCTKAKGDLLWLSFQRRFEWRDADMHQPIITYWIGIVYIVPCRPYKLQILETSISTSDEFFIPFLAVTRFCCCCCCIVQITFCYLSFVNRMIINFTKDSRISCLFLTLNFREIFFSSFHTTFHRCSFFQPLEWKLNEIDDLNKRSENLIFSNSFHRDLFFEFEYFFFLFLVDLSFNLLGLRGKSWIKNVEKAWQTTSN